MLHVMLMVICVIDFQCRASPIEVKSAGRAVVCKISAKKANPRMKSQFLKTPSFPLEPAHGLLRSWKN